MNGRIFDSLVKKHANEISCGIFSWIFIAACVLTVSLETLERMLAHDTGKSAHVLSFVWQSGCNFNIHNHKNAPTQTMTAEWIYDAVKCIEFHSMTNHTDAIVRSSLAGKTWKRYFYSFRFSSLNLFRRVHCEFCDSFFSWWNEILFLFFHFSLLRFYFFVTTRDTKMHRKSENSFRSRCVTRKLPNIFQ